MKSKLEVIKTNSKFRSYGFIATILVGQLGAIYSKVQVKTLRDV